MKRAISLFISAILLFSVLTACGKQKSLNGKNNGSFQIVATIFPEYDWVKNILGDKIADAQVSLLIDNGVDLHSYRPSAEDILKISTCDVFIYVGGESDKWVGDALQGATNKNMIVINLMEILGDKVKEEEIVEGMENEEGGEEEEEYDEHVWLSIKNAVVFCERIKDALLSVDPQNAHIYQKNADIYIEKLRTLDSEYQNAVSASSVKTLIFGDRFPFRYMTDDYGLDYYAAFSGCSAETEASFETITFLANKIDELALRAVMTIEGSDRRIAETIVGSTKTKDQKILTMNSLQGTASKDMQNGASYLSVMKDNLAVLSEALR